MFFSKSVEIEKIMKVYLDALVAGYDFYMNVMEIILKGTTREQTEGYMLEMDRLEREADTIRHQIIRQMLQGGLVVESRKSFMRLIEHMDNIANNCEDIIQEIYLQNMTIHELLIEPFGKINVITKEQLSWLVHAVTGIVSKYDLNELFDVIRKIEDLEAQVDELEHAAVKEIFERPLELAYKMQMRQLISSVGNIADIIEAVSDEIEIIMMARKV